MITESLEKNWILSFFLNSSSISVCIWPVCTRHCPHSCKHFLAELSEFYSDPWFVIFIVHLSPGRDAHVFTETNMMLQSPLAHPDCLLQVRISNQWGQNKLVNPTSLSSPSLYSPSYRFSCFQFLPVRQHEMKQTVIRKPQSYPLDRVICIIIVVLHWCNILLSLSTLSSLGLCIFWQLTG